MTAFSRKMASLLVEGFLIALPILLVYLMLAQFVDALMVLTVPVTDLLPTDWFADGDGQRIFAAGILVVLFLGLGIAARTRPMKHLGTLIEDRTLNRFPPYLLLKSVTQRIGGKDDPSLLQPALLSVTPDIRVLVAIVEELPENELCVFFPLAPTPAMGFLQVVSSSKVQRLEVSMTDALGWILNWGIGTQALLDGRPTSSPETSRPEEPRP